VQHSKKKNAIIQVNTSLFTNGSASNNEILIHIKNKCIELESLPESIEQEDVTIYNMVALDSSVHIQ
jgi:hypothetical protein